MAKRKPLKLKADKYGRVPFSEKDLMHPDFMDAACKALGIDLEEELEKARKNPLDLSRMKNPF